MGVFYYFVSGRGGINRKAISEAGLAYTLKANGDPEQVSGAGPNGESGVFFAYPGADGRSKLNQYASSDAVKWEQISAKAFVGYHPEEPPAPEDLSRVKTALGADIELMDGKPWHIPAARRLPRRMVKEDGEWIQGDVISKHKEFCESAEKLWDMFILEHDSTEPDEEIQVTVNDGMDMIVYALQLNYRIGETEIQLMELIINDIVFNILYAILDWDFWIEQLKKNGAMDTNQVSEKENSIAGEKA